MKIKSLDLSLDLSLRTGAVPGGDGLRMMKITQRKHRVIIICFYIFEIRLPRLMSLLFSGTSGRK